MLPNIWALHEIRRREGRTFLMAVNEITLTSVLWNIWHFENQERLGKVCVLRRTVQRLKILLLRSSNFRFPFQIYEFVLNALDTPFLLLVLCEMWCWMFLRKPESPYISGDLSSPSHTVHPLQRTSRQLLHFVALQEMKQDKRNHFQIIRSPVYNESEACSPRLITIASPGYYGITWSLIPS